MRYNFQDDLRNISYIKKARIWFSKRKIVIRLAKWNPFAPHFLWIVPLQVFSLLFLHNGWAVAAFLLLYSFYGMNIVNHKRKEINAGQAMNIDEMKKTMSEKQIRSHVKDQAFANALAQHTKDYEAYTKKYVDQGINIKKGPEADAIKRWSSEHWNELKNKEEEKLLAKFGLKMEK